MSSQKLNQIILKSRLSYTKRNLVSGISKDYYERAKRNAAYKKLVDKLKESEPDTVKDTAVKKLIIWEVSNSRKEKKIYEASKKSGVSPDKLYKPTLWYYDLFNFLRDHDIPNTSTSNSIKPYVACTGKFVHFYLYRFTIMVNHIVYV